MAGSLLSLKLFLKFLMYSYRFSPSMQIYLLIKILCCRIPDTDFPTMASTGQWSKSCTSLVSFLLSIKSMQILSVNLVLPWCNILSLISSIFRFFKFAEWAEVCRTRKRLQKTHYKNVARLESHYHYHYHHHHHHHQSPGSGSELLGSE